MLLGGEEEIKIEVGPEPEEAEAKIGEEEGIKVRLKVKLGPKGVKDTPPCHQKAAVNAITFTGTRPGTAWPPSRAHGSRSAFSVHETQASLTKRNFNMTHYFQALVR